MLFGSASGLTGSGSRYFDQETSPIPDDSIETGDRFGEVLATAPSFRGDVHDALLIGTPREDGLWADEGAIFWVGQYGGGTLNVAYRYLQSDYYSACGELGETSDFFGAALAGDSRWSDAAGDFPSFDWLVGAPGESLTSPSNGRLGVDYHSSATRQCWDQNSSGVLGTAGVDDFFSSALAAGDFDDDGDSDLAIGAPGETLAGGYEGVVQVLYNNGSVLTSNLDQMFDQDDFAPNSSAETGDWFGDPLAVGDFDGDGAADLAIGVPLEGVVVSGSSRSAAGEVNVLYGGAGVGLSTSGKQTFHQSYPVGMLGTPITNDQLGFALAAGDFDGNGSADLAIGVPNDTQGGISQAGTVQVVYGLDGDLGAFGTVQFASSAASYDESDGATAVILLRSGSAVVAATVDHSRSGGTATPGTDFSYTAGSETWSVGDDGFETYSFSITQDTLDEPNETIVFALANPTAGTAIGSPATFTVTIADDDVAGTLQFGAADLFDRGGRWRGDDHRDAHGRRRLGGHRSLRDLGGRRRHRDRGPGLHGGRRNADFRRHRGEPNLPGPDHQRPDRRAQRDGGVETHEPRRRRNARRAILCDVDDHRRRPDGPDLRRRLRVRRHDGLVRRRFPDRGARPDGAAGGSTLAGSAGACRSLGGHDGRHTATVSSVFSSTDSACCRSRF